MFSSLYPSKCGGPSREKQRKALWNVQQELSKSPEGSSREFLLLLPRNGVVGGPQQGKRVIFE